MPFNISLFNLDILNVLPYGAALYNKAGRCIFANDVFLQLIEMEIKQLTSVDLLELPFFKQDEELKSKIKFIYETGGSFKKNLSGKSFQLDVNLSLFESSGESFLLISLYDISELFTAEGFHYRDIFYNSPLGMYKTTPSGKILMANPAMLKMLGFTSFAELSKRNLEEDGYSNISESRKEFKRKLEEQGELIGYENAWLTNDGKTIYIRENARVLRNSDGSVFYEGTVEDITDRKKAEIALKENAERLRIIFDENPDPVILTNPESGIILNINRTACNLLNYSPDEIISKNITILAAPGRDHVLQDVYSKLVGNVKLSEGVRSVHGVLYSSDKRIIPVEIRAQIVTIDGVETLYTIFRDLTEKRRIEDALIKSEERYRLLFESSHDAIFITHLDGRIFQANPAACEMLGYTEEEIKQLGRNGIIDQNDPNLELALKERELTGKFYRDLRFIRKDGTTGQFEVTSQVFTLKDGTLRTCIIARDISEKKKAEQILKDALIFSSKIYESSPVGIAIYKKSGECISANENFCKIIGASKEQVLAQNFRELDSWKKYGVYDLAEETLTTGQVVHREIFLVSTFGKAIWMDFNAVSFYSKGEQHLLLMNYDINERKKAEDDLRKNEEEIRSILNSLTAHVAVINKNGEITFTNKAWKDFAEANGNPENILINGMNYLEVCKKAADSSAEANDALKGLESILNGELDVFSLEYTCHSPSERRWFYMNVTPLPSGGATISHRNITDIKIVLEEIARKEKLLNTVIGTFPVGIFIADDKGNIILSNEEATKIWEGISLVEADNYDIYKAWWYENGKRLKAEDWALYRAVTNGEKSINEIVKIEGFNGTTKVIQNSALPIYAEDGVTITGAIAAVQDITSKIELEKKIADSEKRFRSLIQNSSDVVILIDTKGEVTYISPSIKNVTGFNPEDQLGTIGFDWIHPDERQNIIVDFQRLAAGELSTLRKEMRVLNVKNEWIWIEAVGYNLLNDPAVGAIVVNYRDINETKMAAKQLKELNDRKDKFFSIIAHDLKSPFTSLLGLTEYLKNDFDHLTNDEIKIFSGNIYQAAKSVFNLLDNLLQWARFQTGSIDFTPVTFNVGTVIKDILDLYNVNILKKNISVVYNPNHNFKVYADKFMAATIIRNIFSNAIKYTPHKGSITISVSGNYLETTITITDTGVGIPKEIINRLFNVGDKISTYGTDDEPGTGLGLILCKDFVEKNGGKIFVESEVDKGTCFNIVLPSIVNNE